MTYCDQYAILRIDLRPKQQIKTHVNSGALDRPGKVIGAGLLQTRFASRRDWPFPREMSPITN
jgi:hypothetical protein